MKKLILFLIVSIFLISLVSAWNTNSLVVSCYQETTNGTNVKDGVCNLNYSGNYSITGNWNNVPYGINAYNDGNYSTWISNTIGGSNWNLIFNYSKPNLNLSNAIWQIRYAVNKYKNITLTDDCLSNPNNIVSLTYSIPTYTGSIYFYCYNQTGQKLLYSESATSSPVFYEESIFWNSVNLTRENLTFINNQNITRYLSVPPNKVIINSNMSFNVSGANVTLYVGNNQVWTGLGSTVPSSTVYTANASDNTWSNSAATASKSGWIINVTSPISLISVNKEASSGSSFVWVYNEHAVLVSNATFVSDIATFTTPVTLSNGVYYVVANSTGSYGHRYNSEVFPITRTYLNIIGGVDNANSNPQGFGDNSTSHVWEIIGINYTQGSASVNSLPINSTVLSTSINNYLSSCDYSNGYCQVPFIFNSNGSLNLTYYNLSFNSEGYLLNRVTYNPTTYETSIENISLNITYDTSYYQVATASLIYNNTIYSSTVSGSNGNYIFLSQAQVPLINQYNTNNSFYWSISFTNLSGSTIVNTSVYNQSTYQISLGNCGDSNSSLAINLTAFDQDNLTKITNWSFKSTLYYYLSNISISRTAIFNDLGITEKNICINGNYSLRVSGQIEYSSSPTYQTSNYYFTNQQISNQTSNLNLGLLLLANTQVFTIKLLDQYGIPVPNYYVNILRYYPGSNSYSTVQTIQTDSNGQGVGFIEINNVKYKFQVVDILGNVVYTTANTVITPQSSPYTITIQVPNNNNQVLTYNMNITGLTYSLSYDKNSKLVTYAYADTNISFTKAELRIFQTNPSGSTSICDNNLTNANGVIQCDLTNYTGQINAQAYNYRSGVSYYINALTFEISNEDYGTLGIFGGICILLMCGFLFSYNEVAGIVAIDLGLIAVQVLHLINFGWVVITGAIAVSVILLITLERG